MKRGRPHLFPSSPVLISRAWWFACAHPMEVLTLGLLGSAPCAALLLIFLHEAVETLFLPGTTAESLKPLAYGIAAFYFVRFPFRLALARWMCQAGRGMDASCLRAAGWTLTHLPTALFYGSVSTLGWMLGTVLVAPLFLTFWTSLAFHRFASGDRDAWRTLKDCSRVPTGPVGFHLMTTCTLLALFSFLILWTAPGFALSLAEWLLKTDVASLAQLFSLKSPAWLAVSISLPLIGIEILWTLAFGLLALEWENLSGGADLTAALEGLEKRSWHPAEEPA